MSSSESESDLDRQGPQDKFYPYFDYIALISEHDQSSSEDEELYYLLEEEEDILPPLVDRDIVETPPVTTRPAETPVTQPVQKVKEENDEDRPSKTRKRVRFAV